jgi:hypothetical protein
MHSTGYLLRLILVSFLNQNLLEGLEKSRNYIIFRTQGVSENVITIFE